MNRLLVVAVLAVVSIPAQERLPSHRATNNDLGGPFSAGGFGERITDTIGDVNGDGFADYAVAAPSASEPLLQLNPGGVVYIHSGRTGQILTRCEGTQFAAEFGLAMLSVGDVNADGVPDLAVGSPLHDSGGLAANGRTTMFSGADGATIWTRDGTTQNTRFGSSIAATPDLTGDGVPDLAVGQPGFSTIGIGRGRVTFVSGATGVPFANADGPTVFSGFGSTAVGTVAEMTVFVGDGVGRVYRLPMPTLGVSVPVLFQQTAGGGQIASRLALAADGQGGLGLVIGRPTLDVVQNNDGAVELWTLAGQRLFQRVGRTVGASFGLSVAAGRDVDGDGADEVLATGGLTNLTAYVEALRPDGTVAEMLETGCAGAPQLASIPDVSGDGRGEYLLGYRSGLCSLAETWVLSAGLEITSAAATPSGAYRASFSADLGAGVAGQDYWQVYGLSGAAPGFAGPAPWPLVPLNVDDTTLVLDQLAGTPFTPDSKGLLDGLGRATTQLNIPAPVAQFLTGVAVTSAMAVFDAQGNVIAASNPVMFRLP